MQTQIIQNDPERTEDHAEGLETVEKRNLALRMAHWSASHWKLAVFGWLGFALVAFALGQAIGIQSLDQNTTGPGESGRMDKILDAGFKQPAGESVLIQSSSATTADPAFRSAVADTEAALKANPDVQKIRSPFAPENSGQVSKDQRSALVQFEIRGKSDDAVDKIQPVVDKVADVQKAHPELFVGQFGDASADKELQASFSDDLKKAGLLSVPITLVILLVAFGAFVAATIPLLLALTAVLATMGLIAFPSQVLPMDDSINAIVLLIGLAVGVDYSMFYLKREREERAARRSPHAALEAAAATSGRAVLVSGLTVIVAMSGMFLAGEQTFASFGVATITVVAVAMLGSLTILPAILYRLGDRVERGHVPFVGRLTRSDGEGRFWSAIIDRVLRHPRVSVVLAAGLLVALALPALDLRLTQASPDTYPQSLAVVDTYNREQAAFPGAEIPANVVVKAEDVNAPAVRAAIDRLGKQAVATGKLHTPITIDVNADHTIANIAIPVEGDGTNDTSNAALAALRDNIVPRTVGALPGVESGVTGLTAESKDWADQLKSALPIVVGFVLLFAFSLMLVSFRSITIAALTIGLNLLSVAAAYGALVLVFQHGWGKGLLDFNSTAGIDPFLPILLFVILFGLSMDYHVFILSRIRETFDGGASTDEAISHGIKSTAGVVTSAAIVMVAVFAVFGTLSMLLLKQFGVGLAVAVLIDATIIRGVLLPASMKLLGDWNWYLPKWLEWLPHLEHSKPLPRPAAKAKPTPKPTPRPSPGPA